jgi:hypothetical protein
MAKKVLEFVKGHPGLDLPGCEGVTKGVETNVVPTVRTSRVQPKITNDLTKGL